MNSKSFNNNIESENIVISGVSIGLPGTKRNIFSENNLEDLINGTNFIESIPDDELIKILDKNIVKIIRDKNGNRININIDSTEYINKLAGLRGKLDLEKEYGISNAIVKTFDKTYELAIAAGIEALKDAKIPLIYADGDKWVLPPSYQHSTGVIFASSFPVLDAFAEEITEYLKNKYQKQTIVDLKILFEKIKDNMNNDAKNTYLKYIKMKQNSLIEYKINRKLLFKLLVMGNAQLAQLIKAKGPNTTINAACASTSQAVCLAEDWIKQNRCKRVIIISGDDPTSDNLLQWIGTGFLILGASSTEKKVENAALPFDKRRNGMILSMGAVGLIVESEKSVLERGIKPMSRILGSHLVNSAYHGTGIDSNHVSVELERFISKMENTYNIDRKVFPKKMVYMSHETFTFANGGSAKAEIDALRYVFGDQIENITISNTKGFTGHPMGVGIEEAVASYSLANNKVPPIANIKYPDPSLGKIKLSSGGEINADYILRFAAGFGSQIVFILFQSYNKKVDEEIFKIWLRNIFDGNDPIVENKGFFKAYNKIQTSK